MLSLKRMLSSSSYDSNFFSCGDYFWSVFYLIGPLKPSLPSDKNLSKDLK